MNEAKVDFIVQLGDFCVPIERNRPFMTIWNGFDRLARNLGARVILHHEPADVAKLPAFPEAAR